MKILIMAPTSRIGRLVVRELLAPEFSVRVIVSDPAQLPEAIRPHVEVVQGALEDAATLQDALAGVEALFFSLPPVSRWKKYVSDQHQRIVRVAARAIQEARTMRVVTAWEEDNDCGPDHGKRADLQDLEDILIQSGASIRHLRVGTSGAKPMLQNKPASARGGVCRSMPVRAAVPTTAEVADAALRWLVRRDWNGIARVPVTGAEPASVVNPVALTTSRVRSGQCFWF